ncbi:tRNA epoxyqueuosine(34) reductase QueG [Aestuariicella hydrocarbonica]|uniref:Epoxyqueuosine reductase n=1 Tax=Pseudomaricurvus hydrocarbonicus TaxID=1470433 RepID=A0A9E5T4M0_9GAMM|nr:tRNA epoxyqueuosine(34) reductase QueG [Aestuariicella hydrocarbonica]NHO68117.1 tRNA epoxyqueuosine(34) reductase QueG [Aestuariicella hydrocarbonica]
MPENSPTYPPQFLDTLAADIKRWGRELGFQQIGITDVDLRSEEPRLKEWLSKGYQGDMTWMGEHGNKRSRPEQLLPGTQRVICARLDYLPADTEQIRVLKDADKAYVSRYALGRDYHKLIRKRLSQLAQRIEAAVAPFIPAAWPSADTPSTASRDATETSLSLQQRAFVDSAPVLERPLAAKAGLGWVGKHTLLLNSQAGSWFFLGEVFTSVPLPLDESLETNRCGDCQACLKVCPTDAFPRPYQLDARRCISYLTIENKGAIPTEFREPMGNRVFGCDDCQAICPWNKYAAFSREDSFTPRHALDRSDLTTLFQWTEAEFLSNTEGSAIRRIGYERWLRNLAVGLGNAPTSDSVVSALRQKRDYPSPLVQEHVEWALQQHDNPGRRRRRKIKARPEQDTPSR